MNGAGYRSQAGLAKVSVLLLLLLLWALPNVGHAADFTYTTNSDATLKITGYTGTVGAIDIPSAIDGTNVTSIGISAFNACLSLTNVTIPDSITNIGDEAFGLCDNLSAISVGALNSFYSTTNGVLFNKSQTSLIRCPGGRIGSYVIPDSVISIVWGALSYCRNLTNVTIGNGVISIGQGAFEYCDSLINVTIPDSVTSIGVGAFDYCFSLGSVAIPDSVTNIGDIAFYFCDGLTNVSIPSSVTIIRDGTFSECHSLTKITIPESVTAIGDEAFFLSGLINVTIPSGVTGIGARVFNSCSSLNGVYFQGDVPSLGADVVSGADNVTAYYLPGYAGWNSTFGGRPTVCPQVRPTSTGFGAETNQFGFSLVCSNDVTVVVAVSTNIASAMWAPVETNSISGGESYFEDDAWTNYPCRFYRIMWP